jgi:hypothetical protein
MKQEGTFKPMIRQWEEYQGVPATASRDRAHVRLDKKGVLVMNRIAHERMGGPEAVVLLYDRRYKVIGLRPSSVDRSNAFPLRRRYKSGRNGGLGMVAVYAQGFFKSYGVKPECTLSFDSPRFESGVLELDLQTARPRSR